jgi:CheY-like chemotaxis protein
VRAVDILVVEDEALIRLSIERMLVQAGHRVVAVASAAAGLGRSSVVAARSSSAT